MLSWLVNATSGWNRIYSDNTVVSTGLVFAHLAAILLAGSAALSADRRVLRSRINPVYRIGYLDEAVHTHRIVLRWLAVAAIAGVMMLLGDVESLFTSWVLWVKLALVFLLLVNGYAITRVEHGLRSSGSATADEAQWKPLITTARISQVLWLATVLAGVTLSNV